MNRSTLLSAKPRKLFITGGTGFVGRSILRHFHGTPALRQVFPETVVFTRDPNSFLSKWPEFFGCNWLTFYEGDILDSESFPPKNDFGYIIHAAADSVDVPNPLKRFDQILNGTRNTLEWAATNKREVPRFLFVSSGGVYGPMPANMNAFPESYNGAPCVKSGRSAYGNAKRAAEQLCSLFYEEGTVVPMIARCFSFIGRDLPLNAHFAIGNFIYDAVFQNTIKVKSSGDAIRTYMAQDDLAAWLLTILTVGEANAIYNVGSDDPLSIKELAFRIRGLLAPDKKIIFTREDVIPESRFVPDLTKARSELNLSLEKELDDEIVSIARLLNTRQNRN